MAAALSVPGLVDEDAGVGIFASNLGWRDAPLREIAERELGLPVAVRHDVRAASDAEYRLGAATAYGDVVVLILGTGIAGGLVLGGRPYTGGGFAGEIGHALSDPEGERCACGAIGCLETISSAGAIARRYSAASGIDVPGAREVLAAAAAGDLDAVRIWDDALRALAEQLARLVAILAPEAVVIGGGLAQAGPALFEPLARAPRRAAQLPSAPGTGSRPPRRRRRPAWHGARRPRPRRRTGGPGQTMILTVTPNPALDLTWHVDALTPGATHRAPAGTGRAGGKGLNVASVLHSQGHEVLALTTVGGPNGSRVRGELEASGIPHRLIPVDAPTRRSLAIVDDTRGETTVLNELGAALAPAEAAELAATAAQLGRTSRAVAISGSLPPGFGPEQLGAARRGARRRAAFPSSSTRAEPGCWPPPAPAPPP